MITGITWMHFTHLLFCDESIFAVFMAAVQWVWVGWPSPWSSNPKTRSLWSTLACMKQKGWHIPKVERGNQFRSAYRYGYTVHSTEGEVLWPRMAFFNTGLSLHWFVTWIQVFLSRFANHCFGLADEAFYFCFLCFHKIFIHFRLKSHISRHKTNIE